MKLWIYEINLIPYICIVFACTRMQKGRNEVQKSAPFNFFLLYCWPLIFWHLMFSLAGLAFMFSSSILLQILVGFDWALKFSFIPSPQIWLTSDHHVNRKVLVHMFKCIPFITMSKLVYRRNPLFLFLFLCLRVCVCVTFPCGHMCLLWLGFRVRTDNF